MVIKMMVAPAVLITHQIKNLIAFSLLLYFEVTSGKEAAV